MCTNTEYTRPRVSKELFLLGSEKLALWHFVVVLLAIPPQIFGISKVSGYKFIFKNERNLLDEKGKITFMILVSVCDRANSYVDANARRSLNLFSRLCGIYHWISLYGQGQLLQKYRSHINYVEFWLL